MRKTEIKRKTKETEIQLAINLDGTGKTKINSSIPFFDHMLNLFAFNCGIDLELKAKGDIETGKHHLIEDIGIVFGQAFNKILGNRTGIKRYGFFKLPMDEALAEIIIDISGRPYLKFWTEFKNLKKKDFDTGFDFNLVEDFLLGFVQNAKLTLHCNILYGKNNHHKIEALFKCFGKALKEAISFDNNKIPSTKGKI